MDLFKRNVDVIKEILKNHVSVGDTVVDATAGNGNDTLFLASLVSDEGAVYAFDVQELAIEKTKLLLEKNDVLDNVQLVHDGHESVDKYLKPQTVAAAVYNLGYLPNSDESVITVEQTTITSLEKMCGILKKYGVIAIVSYYGHDGGLAEKNAVDSFAKNLHFKQFSVVKYQTYNRENNPPIIYVIKKL